MNQETNNPEQEKQLDNTTSSAPKKSYIWIYGAVIMLLVISNIYTYTLLNKTTNERDLALHSYSVSDSSRVAVEADYNAALLRLDDLVSQNTEMNDELNAKDGEIAKLRSEIDAIIKNKNATTAELGKAKRLIGQLNGKVRSYEERIAALESDNMRLDKENEILEEERASLAEEREELQRLGSVLHASNIRMIPIDIRRGGKRVKETEKAKRVDVFRVSFDIDENRIAETSVKELYIRIIDPNGIVLSNAAYGSGVTTVDGEKPLTYTISKLVELQKGQPINDVTVDWTQDSDYQEGNYKIEIHQGGFLIGSGTVELR